MYIIWKQWMDIGIVWLKNMKKVINKFTICIRIQINQNFKL